MSDGEIALHVLKLSETDNDHSIHINQLVTAMVQLDEEKFENTLSGFFLRYNFEQTLTDIVYPFLEKTGILWQTGNVSPAQEHFISNLIRQKVIVGIDGLPLKTGSQKMAILFLPEHELHEIGLLFSHYLLRKAGFRVIYLGQAVPHPDLLKVFNHYKPQLLVTSLTVPLQDSSVEKYLQLLNNNFDCAKIAVSGLQIQSLPTSEPTARLQIIKNADEMRNLMTYV